MYRFEDDRYYRTSDPELLVIATPGTMAKWRCMGVGPPFMKFGGRILYLGKDLNEWLDRHRVDTQVDVWPMHPADPERISQRLGDAATKWPPKGSRRTTGRAAVRHT